MGTNDTTNLRAASTLGTLLLKAYQFNDELVVDLYGDWSDEEGAQVENVLIAGTQHNVTSLMSGHQLEALGYYLDFKNSLDPTGRQLANSYRNAATRY